jgi:hypothetical protein
MTGTIGFFGFRLELLIFLRSGNLTMPVISALTTTGKGNVSAIEIETAGAIGACESKETGAECMAVEVRDFVKDGA